MNTDILLRNYSEYKKNIIWNGNKHKVVNTETINKPERGIAGFTENKNMVGVFVRDNDAFFLIDDKEYKIDIDNFQCSNTYQDKKTRQFKFINQSDVICEIVYEPYIDPGMVIYDSDPEDFDFLLFLSNNILHNKEILKNFIIAKSKG